MNQLVYMHNNRPVTDSVRVAEESGRRHRNVMRDIKNLKMTEEFNALNFEHIKYRDSRGREQVKCLMTQEGFAFLILGFRGDRVSEFKEKYVREFNRMATALTQEEPLTMLSLFNVVNNLMNSHQLLAEHVYEMERRLESQITLNSRQQRILQQAITERVHGLESDKFDRRYAFQQLHRDIKDRWEVSSYRDVLQKDLPDVLQHVAEWLPSKRICA